MPVAEHLVSLYVATCGQSGPGLGCDEKEIILLAYVILEAATGQIIGTKQILVRPDGGLIKDRCNSTSSDISVTTTTTTKIATSTPPPLPPSSLSAHITTIATTTSISTISDASVNGNQNIVNGGFNIVNIINNNNNNNNSNINSNSSILQTTINDNITNNGTIVKLDNVTPNLTASTPIVGSSNINNNNNNILISNNNITNEVSPNGDHNELPPIALAMTVGKPLQEAIAEFDEYLLDLALRDTEFKIITDGQLPLRQCLHREACVKEFDLPSYYNNFSDLRKEYNNFKNGDMSRALVAVRDIPKMLQMPTTLMPQSIDAIIKDLNITSTSDNEFYMRECRDMVNVIQHLLKLGHKFTANETVNMILEPGICSIDDEIDGNCIVRARGLPWQSSDQDIAKFFRGLNVAKGGVALCLSPLGRRNGEALIRFISQEHRDMALKRHKHHIGNRYIEVYRATGEDFLSVAGGASNEALAFLSKGAQVIIRMRGLPYDCTAKQVLDFFNAGENPCQILDGTEGVLFVKKPDGRATGDAFVLFANDTDAPKALAKHRESIGQRYIELFRSTTAEVQQVLNRSLDPKTYEPNNQPPLIAQLPPMQLSLLPQHLITSGTTKNCIRLRGLPYEAMVEHILHFLDDFAKHIIYQGVHMVINAQGHPSGEAFIQMDSEDSARLCAQRKHHQFMVFGKKYRYIEVFQCSGDDMNNVLNGGIQSPVVSHAHSHTHLSSTKQQSAALLSPGSSIIANPFAALATFVPTASLLASPPPPPSPHHYPTQPTHSSGQHHHHHHHHHNATAAYYTPSLVYWPYPSPPVSPNSTYLNRTTHQSPAQLTGTHHPHPMYALDYIAAIPAPTNFNSQQRSALAISPVNGGTVMMTSHKPPPPAAAVIPLMGPKHFMPTSPTYHKLNVATTTTINNNNNNNNDNNNNNNNIRSHQMPAIVTKDNAPPAVLNVCLTSNNKMLFTPTTTTVPITIDKHHLHNDHNHHSTESDMGNAVKQQQQQQHCSSSPTSNAKDIAVVTTTPRVELFIS